MPLAEALLILCCRASAWACRGRYPTNASGFGSAYNSHGVLQSFRTGVLGEVPKNCFKFQVANVPYALNTSVTMTLAFQADAFTNATVSSAPLFSYLPGPQAAAIMFADSLNSDNSFELTFQALNASNAIQLSPTIRKNIKAFPNGNYTVRTLPSMPPMPSSCPRGKTSKPSPTRSKGQQAEVTR